MHTIDHRGLADALLPAVLEAGRIEMRHYTAGVEVERKADRSPVTIADREAEEVLIAALMRVAPDIPVVAEERSAAGLTPETGKSFFLVDPLDGTREFIKKNGDFTINIGLIVDAQPVFGIVYAPAVSRLFVTLGATEAAEALVAPDAAPGSVAACRPVAITSREPDPAALVALESRSHRSEATAQFLSRYPIAEAKAAGSSLKFCLIARGEADLYPRIGETCEWDTAAGHAILAAAGGTVTRLDGSPLLYGKAGAKYLNPHFVAWGRRPLVPVV